jgi:hypothetical protein
MCWCSASRSSTRIDLNSSSSSFAARSWVQSLRILSSIRSMALPHQWIQWRKARVTEAILPCSTLHPVETTCRILYMPSLSRTSCVDVIIVDVIMRSHADAENPDGHAESAADQKLLAVFVIL